ncbi:putative phage tail protein I [Pectobacterium atrosepticum SCRI1043]|uniref:Phage tail protein I n=1 Tax=Pectobacterium atrosepticum (strain SCRI 1043 / ATCC BAA-672) TaxID=218491 RepID=Q6D3Y5_PECAS|nr:phage tail protein I [Pectobacterium atrosepticum]MCL6320362.1 phage tail protein I [Pectobacterium atrosepticum]CAG75509.1 putative phage tail protein I [Pectobacterium atrosepticum SCRI1043]
MGDLLPPSASGFMRSVAASTQKLSNIPVDLSLLWNAERCPTELLPYLAWALSVDRWDKNWSEQTKRQVIRSAWLIHRQKGTIAALRRVVEPFGYLIRIVEWWQNGEAPGTFRLDIGVQDSGITEEVFYELERLIADAKPASRHLLGLNINLDTQGVAYVAALSYGGDELTVYPYFPENITVSGLDVTGAALHLIDNVSVTA